MADSRYGMVGTGVNRADLPDIPAQGFLGQSLADEAQARLNFRNSQVPSPLALPTDQPLVQTPAPLAMPSDQPAAQEPFIQSPVAAQTVETPERVVQSIAQEAQKGVEEGVYQAGVQQGLADQQAKYEQKIREVQKKKDEARQKAVLDEQKADEEIDRLAPKDFWADKSTGTRLAAALAMGLGAYGAAMTGGQNSAMQIIDGAIQRDLGLQKEKLQRAKDKRANIRTALGDQIAILGDEEAAELSVLNNAYKKFETQLAAAAAKTNNEMQKLNAQKLMQEIDLKRQEIALKRQEKLTQIQLSKGLQKGQEINPEMLPESQRERYIQDDEFSGLARTTKEAQDFRASVPQYKDTMRSLNRLLEITNTGGKSLSPELRAEVGQIRQLLVGTLREDVLGPGTIQQAERDLLLNDVLGDPAGLVNLDSATKVRIKNLAQNVQQKKLDQAKSIGLNSRAMNTDATSVMVKNPDDGRIIRIPRSSLKTAQERAKKQGINLEVMDAGLN